MKLKRICAGLMAASIAIASLCVVAFAVEPSYKVSSDYKDTLYYNNLLAVELTGDGATDVIAVALSQLGYHEGNNQGDLEGSNAGGSKNFVEYNVLFGKLDNGEGNGYSYGYAWCAAFVNWCLRQARVDERLTGGMYVSCAAWRNWFIGEGAKYGASYHARTDDYIPKKGDLIFYKSLTATHSRATDHIGIVLKCENGVVYAIEGNGDNRVALHEYSLDNRYIVGYGSIAYKTADVPEVDYYRTEDHLPGLFIAGKGILSAYAGPDTSTGKVASLTAGAVYRITAVQGRYGRVELADGQSGWISLKRFIPMTTDPYYTVQLVNGTQTYEIRVMAGASCTIPEEVLLTETLGELTDLLGWGVGDGEIFTAGQVLTPTCDLVLQAVTKAPEEQTTHGESDRAENDSASESEQTVGTDRAEDGEATSATPTETEKEQTGSRGCNGTLGAAGMLALLTSAALLICGKKKE